MVHFVRLETHQMEALHLDQVLLPFFLLPLHLHHQRASSEHYLVLKFISLLLGQLQVLVFFVVGHVHHLGGELELVREVL